jgi:hypothetical protein
MVWAVTKGLARTWRGGLGDMGGRRTGRREGNDKQGKERRYIVPKGISTNDSHLLVLPLWSRGGEGIPSYVYLRIEWIRAKLIV